jgi:hypothetical protein
MNTKQKLSEFEEELKTLSEARDSLDRKIRGLVQVIEGLRLMSEEPNPMGRLSDMLGSSDEVGLTDAVRNYFEYIAAGPVSPVEVRDALRAAGYEGGGPQSALLAVHSIISRMQKKGEVDAVERDGKTAYVWVSLLKRAVRQTEEQKGVFVGRMMTHDHAAKTSGKKFSERWIERKAKTKDTK